MIEKPQLGNVLVAEPFMIDPNFKRGVVLLCEHSDQGSVGFVLNKKLDMEVTELLADFPDFDAHVYFGGPVQTDTIHYIHRKGDILEDSVEVINGVFWGGDFEKLKFLISTKMIGPKDIRFFVGYTGWSGGQLNQEMRLGSWVLAEMFPNYLFQTKPSDLWHQVMTHKGNAFSVIAQMPDALNAN